MIQGRPRETRCLHCHEDAIRKGKCKACWTKYDTNLKRKAKGLPYDPLPILPREHAGRAPKPRPQEPTPLAPVSVTMVGNIRVTRCPADLDAEFQQRGLGRIAALKRAEREWAG